jgi:nitroimidazol reductase NimA-like FMN-containing flavoprotein (pyridoxamine 5'-phosphate oxidase superfamily)
MAIADNEAWVEHLNPTACWDLLAQCPVGRLGVVVDGSPEIFPVNFRVDGHSIVFRTDRGQKVYAIARHPDVCFEVDNADDGSRTGWSVLVKGRAADLSTTDAHAAATALRLESWTFGAKDHWIRVIPTHVSGRRIHRTF